MLDAIVILTSYFLAYWLQFYYLGNAPSLFPYLDRGIWPACFVAIFLFYNAVFSLYQPKRVMGRRLEASNVVKANVLGMATIILILYIWIKQIPYAEHFSRMFAFWFAMINSILTIAERNCLRIGLMFMRRRGFNLKHILLIGYSRAAEGFIDRVNANPQWGYKIRGILDDKRERGEEYKGVKVIGSTDNLDMLLSFNRLDEIIITLGLEDYKNLEQIVNSCEKSGVHTKFVPDYNNIIPTKPYTEDLLGMPVIHIRHVPLTNGWNKLIKRTMDVIGSFLAIIVFSPVMLVTAILVKATSPGPLIFTQERVGLHNRPFKMYKFRSMGVQSRKEEAKGWTTKNDPRVTSVGKIIRKTSIDELPQLFNVLKGDMSLVGPRPERPQYVEKFKEEIPRYMVKHQVRPGMTGWAQVNGFRGDTSIRGRIEHDLYYIENWTIGFDIKILILTVFKGFINKNAY